MCKRDRLRLWMIRLKWSRCVLLNFARTSNEIGVSFDRRDNADMLLKMVSTHVYFPCFPVMIISSRQITQLPSCICETNLTDFLIFYWPPCSPNTIPIEHVWNQFTKFSAATPNKTNSLGMSLQLF